MEKQDLLQKFFKCIWAELAACHIHCFLLQTMHTHICTHCSFKSSFRCSSSQSCSRKLTKKAHIQVRHLTGKSQNPRQCKIYKKKVQQSLYYVTVFKQKLSQDVLKPTGYYPLVGGNNTRDLPVRHSRH